MKVWNSKCLVPQPESNLGLSSISSDALMTELLGVLGMFWISLYDGQFDIYQLCWFQIESTVVGLMHYSVVKYPCTNMTLDSFTPHRSFNLISQLRPKPSTNCLAFHIGWWVPGISRGLHWGQPASRWTTPLPANPLIQKVIKKLIKHFLQVATIQYVALQKVNKDSTLLKQFLDGFKTWQLLQCDPLNSDHFKLTGTLLWE